MPNLLPTLPPADLSGQSVLAVHPALGGFTLNPLAGGKDLAAGECTNALLEMGCRVSVWPLEWSGNSAPEKLLSQHEIFWSPSGRVTLLPTCLPTGQCLPLNLLGAVMQRVRPRLVHVHQTASPLVTFMKKAGFTVPVLLTNHSGIISPHIRDYDWVVVPSLWMQRQILAQHPGLAGRCQMIPYFVQPEYLQPEEPPTRSGVSFIGLLNDDRKGLDILLEAMALLQRSGRDYELKVVGEGRLWPQFRNQAAQSGLRVEFLGKLSAEGNARLLRESSLFCMPSRQENFPIVYLEALACGAPIIGYAPVVEELNQALATETGCGFDAQRQTGPDLARLIDEWMTVKGQEFAGRRADIRKKIRKLYGLSAFRAAYRALYRQLLTPAGTPAERPRAEINPTREPQERHEHSHCDLAV